MKNIVSKESELAAREKRIYADLPVSKAVAAMVIPTIISQIVTVIYNLADTWYVGLTENAAAVAAISLCLPVYNIMTAIANLFGIGGASVITRAVGGKNINEGRNAFALSIWGALAFSALYSVLLLAFGKPFLLKIGGDEENINFAVNYTLVTMVIGGIPTVLSATLAHLIRSTGKSNVASFGITLGAVLNMGLDPLFMFVLLPSGNEVLGAAIATTVSNIVSACFFVVYILIRRRVPIFRFTVEKGNNNFKIFFNLLKSGVPSFLLLAAAQVSNFFLNGIISEIGASQAVAGIGVVRKIDSLAYAVNQGITQGMLPIVAYCFVSGRRKRMKSVIVFCSVCTVAFSLLCSASSYFFAPYLIRFFINDDATVAYGASFLRVLCIAVAVYPLLFVIIAVFQAVGDGIKPFLLSLLHKGSLDIILFFVVKKAFDEKYVLWVSPVTAFIALSVGIFLIVKFFKKSKISVAEN